MANDPGYKLLLPAQQQGIRTQASILYIVQTVSGIVQAFGAPGKPKVVVDNNAVTLYKPGSNIVLAAGIIPHDPQIFLYAPKGTLATSQGRAIEDAMPISLPKGLEQMTKSELFKLATGERRAAMNPELLVMLQEYVLANPQK